MKITTILGVVAVIIVIGIVAYVLNSEGVLTVTDVDNMLQNALQTVKDWWASVTADPVA